MARGIFRTLSESDLLNRRDLYLGALDSLAAGDKAVGFSLGGKSYTYRPADTDALMDLLDEVTWALQLKNPNAHGKRVTVTYSDFSSINVEDK